LQIEAADRQGYAEERLNMPYRSDRCKSWVKVKNPHSPRCSDRRGNLVTAQATAHSDFSVVVKVRERSAKPWSWAIYRAGRGSAVKTSSKVFYATRLEAQREGKKALRLMLSEFQE
jgi:hypothetical protein